MRAIALLFLFCALARAEDFYVAQNATGLDDGTSCANAKALSWHNDGDNWGVGAGKISAGDTVHYCGTITNVANILGSGTVGNPITIVFETGCAFVLSAATTTVGIYANGYDNLILDGGVNGRIEWTNNGTAGPYSNAVYGAAFVIPNGNVEVKNLIVTNGFVHLTSDTRTNEAGSAIHLNMQGATNVSVHHCYLDHNQHGVQTSLETSSGRNGGLFIYSNTIDHVSHGIAGGTGGANVHMDGLWMFGNLIDGNETWMQANNYFHLNAIYWYTEASATGAYLSNIFIFNNKIGPMTGLNNNSTANVFLSASIQGDARVANTYIFNNLMHGADYANGKISLWICTNVWIFNNTLDNESGALISAAAGWGGNLNYWNNILSRSTTPLSIPSPQPRESGFTCNWNNYSQDGNVIFAPDNVPWNTNNTSAPHYGWTNAPYSFDKQGNTNTAQFTSVGSDFTIPVGTNGAASAGGTNLSAWVTSIGGALTNALRDITGALRPASAPWSMGAYEPNYVSEAAAAAPAAITLNGRQTWGGRVTFQ